MKKTNLAVFLLSIFLLGSAGLANAGIEKKSKIPGNIQAEIDELKKSQTQNPADPDIYFILGTDYWRLDQYEEAIKNFQRAVRLQPDYFSAHWNLSLLYNLQGEGADAIIHMKKAERLFLKMKDVKALAQARKKLRNYFVKYRYKPEDFEISTGFWEKLF
ncbi:MAG: tetratricopeptide repeat protein [Nitrospinaceae bacterium]